MKKFRLVGKLYGSRSPSWGAWIEIVNGTFLQNFESVAPPRGERGLKCDILPHLLNAVKRRSPSWGAWIEIAAPCSTSQSRPRRSPSWGAWIEIRPRRTVSMPCGVAPPRGERGLKSL